MQGCMRCSDADTQLEALAFGHVLNAKISAHARRMQIYQQLTKAIIRWHHRSRRERYFSPFHPPFRYESGVYMSMLGLKGRRNGDVPQWQGI